jgi:signal peptidase I
MNAPALPPPGAPGVEVPPDEAPASRERSLLWYIGRGASFGVLGILGLLAVLVLVVPMAVDAQRYTITGGSMEPSIPLGSLIVVRPASIDDVNVGDAVTFQLVSGQPEVATHRVVGIATAGDGTRTLVTKGDANAAADAEPVRAEQLRGIVMYTIPGLGWMNAIFTGDMRAWVLPAIAVVLFGYAGWMFVRAAFDRRRRRAADPAVIPADDPAGRIDPRAG